MILVLFAIKLKPVEGISTIAIPLEKVPEIDSEPLIIETVPPE